MVVVGTKRLLATRLFNQLLLLLQGPKRGRMTEKAHGLIFLILSLPPAPDCHASVMQTETRRELT